MRYLYLAAKDRLGLSRSAPRSIEEHLDAAAKWLLVAQQATNDDGVAHSYDIRLRKWLPSYPETTGYIIPTLFDYAKYFNQPQYREPALRMARWEAQEQLPDGGVRAGTMSAEVIVPTIFNTGQVVFGQARAALESDEPALRASLERAADWLVAAQDEDGCWRRFPSPFTSTKIASYNTRCAFALCRAFGVIPKQSYLEAADRNISWALSRSRDNGWLPGNCLTENSDDSALTHTIAYSIRGILEVGICLDKPNYVEHAQKMAAAVANAQKADGSLPAYLRPDWTPSCEWSCVTGNAQMAINWQRLAQATGNSTARKWAVSTNRFNMSLQDLCTADVSIRGAIKGSHPIDGGYMTYRYPNWAA